jgi:hypothetical protein
MNHPAQNPKDAERSGLRGFFVPTPYRNEQEYREIDIQRNAFTLFGFTREDIRFLAPPESNKESAWVHRITTRTMESCTARIRRRS